MLRSRISRIAEACSATFAMLLQYCWNVALLLQLVERFVVYKSRNVGQALVVQIVLTVIRNVVLMLFQNDKKENEKKIHQNNLVVLELTN